jgi:hypothetical protein
MLQQSHRWTQPAAFAGCMSATAFNAASTGFGVSAGFAVSASLGASLMEAVFKTGAAAAPGSVAVS